VRLLFLLPSERLREIVGRLGCVGRHGLAPAVVREA
jgi:hypothetical protein